MLVNWAQPASRIDLFRPAFCATLRPGCCAVPRAERVLSATRRSSSPIASQVSTSVRAVLWWKSRRWSRTVRHCFASARRMRPRFPDPGLARAFRRCRPAIVSRAASRKRGLPTIWPSEVVRNRVTPTSTPTCRPAAVLPDELQRVHRAAHGPVLLDLDPADRLEAGVRPPAAVGGFPLGAVPGHERHLVEPGVRLEPRVAGLLPGLGGLHPVEEPGHHLVEAPQRLLLRG